MCPWVIAFVVSPAFVDEEQVEGPRAVLGGGARVAPGGLETAMTEELGDDNQVGATAQEGCGEGVPDDVGRGVVVEAGCRCDPRDDVTGQPVVRIGSWFAYYRRSAVILFVCRIM